jgi:beta-glucosidase
MPMAADDALSTSIEALRQDVVPLPDPVVRALQMGATWNVGLARRAGAALGDRHAGQVVGVQLDRPLRDPRRGRNELAFAEDPLLAARLATAYFRGMSGSCVPVIADFDVDAYGGRSHGFSARTANDFELPVYRAVFEAGGARGIVLPQRMFDETPMVTRSFVEDVIRPWGGGQVTVFSQGASGSAVETLRSGADGFIGRENLTAELTEAFRKGRLTDADLVVTATRREALHGDARAPTGGDHDGLDLALARESVVLLRNDGLLPLLGGAGVRVAVVHPGAANTISAVIEQRVAAAGGSVTVVAGGDRIALSVPNPGRYLGVAGDDLRLLPDRTAFEVIEWSRHVFELRDGHRRWGLQVEPSTGGTVLLRNYLTGHYLTIRDDRIHTTENRVEATAFDWESVADGAGPAVEAAQSADVVVVIVGNCPEVDGRGGRDRENLFLPGQQERTLRAVRAANPNTVLAVLSSYPYALDWANANIGGILWSAPGGTATEIAVAEVLFGDHAPTGRLPQTWHRGADTTFDTYMYHQGEPLYPFGHGLTFTTFEYDPPVLSAPVVEEGGRITVTVRVRNTGYLDGVEVVQLYTRQLTSRVRQPRRQLRHFARVAVPAGGTRTVAFALSTDDLSYYEVTRESWIVETAEHEVMIAGHAARLTVRGRELPARRLVGVTLLAVCADETVDMVLVDGPGLEATGTLSWLVYRACDLTGCLRWTLLVRNPTEETRHVGLHLDDPKGPLIGSLSVPAGSEAVHTAAVTAVARGVRDLFLVFTQPGLRAMQFTFSGPARSHRRASSSS